MPYPTVGALYPSFRRFLSHPPTSLDIRHGSGYNADVMLSDDENLQRLLGALFVGMVIVFERFALDKYGQKKRLT